MDKVSNHSLVIMEFISLALIHDKLKVSDVGRDEKIVQASRLFLDEDLCAGN
jgi:hypothetical protein